MPQSSPDTVTAPPPPAGLKFRVAVCGELGSGKSTVLNALLRSRVLPDNLGRDSRPVIVARHGSQPQVEILYGNGKRTKSHRIARPDALVGAEHLTLWSDQPHLAGIEIVEVPLTKAEEVTEAEIGLVRSSEIMVCTTIASQAWRLTEKMIVERLGDALPAHRILAVTRADKLRSDNDRKRLRERIVRETAHLFPSCVFMNGARSKIDKSLESHSAWQETGGVELFALISAIAASLPERAPEPPEAVEAAPLPAEVETAIEVVDLAAYRNPRTARQQRRKPEPPASDEQPAATRAETPLPDTAATAAPAPAAAPALATGAVPDAGPEPARLRPDPDPRPAAPMQDPAAVATGHDEVRAIAAGLSGALLVGLCPETARDRVETLHGDPGDCHALAEMLCPLYRALNGIFEAGKLPQTVTALALSTGKRRLLFQHVDAVGLLFLSSDAEVMLAGNAQTALARLVRALAPASA